MKGLFFLFALLSAALEVSAQKTGRPAERRPAPRRSDLPAFVVGERGPHHRVWHAVQQQTNEFGDVVVVTNQAYVELGGGMHYRNARGEWIEADETIEILPNGGAAARHGPHRVFFSGNLNTPGAIVLETPDGKRMRSHVLGLSYFDAASGKSVLIAEVKASDGQLYPPNVVVYPDAFEGLKADVRYTYRKGSFEQDVILRERPPSPQVWGLDPATTRLQVLTEFLDPPQPEKHASRLERRRGSATDELLDFGEMKMGRGKAFSLGDREAAAGEISVAKKWLKLEGRDFLVEEVEMAELADELQALPPADPAALNASPDSLLHIASVHRLLPAAPRLAARPAEPIRLATAPRPRNGLVLDYQVVLAQNGFTFQGDTTYFVTNAVTLSGIITIEGGAVIKYAPGASLTISAPFTWNWKASDYHPVVFTGRDDNSVGQPVPGSTGVPIDYNYASPALKFLGNGATLSHFRIASAVRAFEYTSAGLVLIDGQMVNCGSGVSVGQGSLTLRNVLFANVLNALVGLSYSDVVAENVTFGGQTTAAPANLATPASFVTYSPYNLRLTNCILANLSAFAQGSDGNLYANYNGFYNNSAAAFGTINYTASANPFQVKGAGNYYLTNLADGSGLRDKGTVAINPALLADLNKKTTYPPTNSPVINPAATLWKLVVARDTDTPDLGYHYDALDYLCTQITLNSGPHTVTNGVAIATYGSSGFVIQGGGGIKFAGTPDAMNHLVWYPSVQEQPVRLSNVSTYNMPMFNVSAPGAVKLITLLFTEIGMQGWRQSLFDSAVAYNFPVLAFRNCWLRSVYLGVGGPYFYGVGPGPGISMVNNALERCGVSFFAGWSTYMTTTNQNPLSVTLYNNLFWSNTVSLTYADLNDNYHVGWMIRDNLFDGSAISLTGDGAYLSRITGGFNAFNASPSGNLAGANDVSLTSVAYASPAFGLGPWYIDSTIPASALIDTGSRTVGAAGLAQFTLLPTQAKDTAQVDIGFHYVAVGANGLPLDTDGDNFPDYVEDTNGNGIFDVGDKSDFMLANASFCCTAMEVFRVANIVAP